MPHLSSNNSHSVPIVPGDLTIIITTLVFFLLLRVCVCLVFFLIFLFFFVDPLVINSYTSKPFDEIFRRPYVIKCRPAYVNGVLD